MTSPPGPGGLTILDANGDQYFLYGDTRIKITEHFSISGKSYSDFVVDMICHKNTEKPNKTA